MRTPPFLRWGRGVLSGRGGRSAPAAPSERGLRVRRVLRLLLLAACCLADLKTDWYDQT